MCPRPVSITFRMEPTPPNLNQTSRLGRLLVVANLLFWIYFGLAFARASYPYSREVWNYNAPTALAGYTFFGHSLGVRESAFQHPFFKAMCYTEFPSFALTRLGQNLLFPHVTGDQLFAGISEGGWRLLVVVLLSFFQWYLTGSAVQKLWRNDFSVILSESRSVAGSRASPKPKRQSRTTLPD